jgi:hypothetical protein
MTQAIQFVAVISGLFLAAALLVVWSRKTTWLRAAAIPLAVTSSVVAGFVMLATLGFAVPLINGITAPAGDYPILSSKLVNKVGIFATLDLPEGPRLYWLPWDNRMAEQLQEMEGDPNNGGTSMVVPPFEFSWDQHKPSFQPMPQPKFLPDKPADSAPPPPRFAA